MEWKLFNEDDTEDFIDEEVESEAKEVTLDEDSADEFVVVNHRPAKSANPRRAIEILREQKQLEADTWDFFDS